MSKIVVHSSEPSIRHPFRVIREALQGVFSCRELMWTLFLRDLKAQYRQSVLGYFWLVAPPVTMMLVWVFLNSQQIVNVETDVPYPLFALVGTTLWAAFSTSVILPLSSFNGGRSVFMKLKVSPDAFALSGFCRALFDAGLRFLLITPLYFYYGFGLSWNLLLFPLAALGLMIFGFAIGLALVPVGGFYGDVTNALTTFLGLLMYTAPIVYGVPDNSGILATIMKANPLTPLVGLCRESLFGGDFQMLWIVALICVGSILMIGVGFVLLRIAMPHLVARMGM